MIVQAEAPTLALLTCRLARGMEDGGWRGKDGKDGNDDLEVIQVIYEQAAARTMYLICLEYVFNY